MLIYEFRETAYNKAFDLIDEANEHIHKAKSAICDLYDCLESCYEADQEEDQYEDESIPSEENYANIENVEVGEINYKNRMRRGMRGEDPMDHTQMRGNMRRSMRSGMRRRMRHGMKRYDRYSY